MDSSPADRLPEADSLPDGFVESSTESPRNANSCESLHDEPAVFLKVLEATRSDGASGTGEGLSSATDSFAAEEAVAATTNDYKEMEVPPGADPGFEHDGGSCPNSAGDNKVYLKLHSSNQMENCVDEYAGSLSSKKKQETTEVKRKSSKNNFKLEKELLELNLKYQKETTEVKRKSSKNNFKLEKELLELNLKYQKVIAERDAAVAVRDRLESLCRELQRQNKLLMEECHRVSTEGQNMRLDLSKKFNDAIKDVNSKLEEQKNDCISQLKENETLRNKLTHLAEQYALSEQQFAQKLKQKTLELQLADLKMQQQQERSAQEQSQVQSYGEQITELLETEKNLRLKLAADGEKFQQFQDALMKSNEVLETFKQEMEKMAKLIKELKKENDFLKSKCEKSDIALVKLVEEREHMKKQVEKAKNQREKLESLCRSLQAERKQNLNIDSINMRAASIDSTKGVN
ncbi:hypothetical protein HPP92_006486 [Vanilla planifolia]|uniref:Alpha-taxilin n=1 Tax=Vanilla planifolia TaxID=51239 RepID=A0A835V9P7_VANPL|nr:hypothetical protein HPP92_006486 [Vanilla planifolia]